MEGGSVFSQQCCYIVLRVWEERSHIVGEGKRRKLCAGDLFPLQFMSNGFRGFACPSVISCSQDSHVNLCVHDVCSESTRDAQEGSACSVSTQCDDMFDSQGTATVDSKAAPCGTNDNYDIDGGMSYTGPFPNPGGRTCINTHLPFSEDLRAASWNSQALFAANTHKQFRKRRHACALIRKTAANL